VNAIIDLINKQVLDPIAAQGIKIPVVGTIHPFGGLKDLIPHLDTGGVIGADGAAYLHRGEAVINPTSSPPAKRDSPRKPGWLVLARGPLVGELHLHEVTPGGARENASEIVRRLAQREFLYGRS
jgi:hypothetical protein